MSEKLNQQLEQQDLEAMADQLLAEDAAKREEEDSANPARSWTIRPLPPFRRRPSSPQTRN